MDLGENGLPATYPVYRLSTRMYGALNATKSMRLRWCNRFVEILTQTKSMSHCRNPKIYIAIRRPLLEVDAQENRFYMIQIRVAILSFVNWFSSCKNRWYRYSCLQNKLISLCHKNRVLEIDAYRNWVLRCLGRNRLTIELNYCYIRDRRGMRQLCACASTKHHTWQLTSRSRSTSRVESSSASCPK